MLDHEHRDVALGIDVQQEQPQLFGFGFGKPGDRFIEQNEPGVRDDGARNLQSALVTERQCSGGRLRLAGKPDRFENDKRRVPGGTRMRPGHKMIEA